MSGLDCDVLIVGSRVAGASLAIELARRGFDVMLVDKARFPSDTISTHVMRYPAVQALERLGVLAEVEATGIRRITRFRTCIDDCVLEGPQVGYSLAPRRMQLDAILLGAALATGRVDFREATRVVSLLSDADGGRVTGARCRDAQGREYEVRCRLVVGADGRWSTVAQLAGAPFVYERPPGTPSYYGYFADVEAFGEPTTELFFADECSAFVIPMEPGRHCVSFEFPKREFKQFRTDAYARFMERVAGLHGLGARLRSARLEGKLLGTAGVPTYVRASCGNGWALVGDAAICKDPTLGVGIQDALTQATLLADAFASYVDSGDWPAAADRLQRQLEQTVLPNVLATTQFKEGELSPDKKKTLRAVLSSPLYTKMWVASSMPLLQGGGMVPPGIADMIRQTDRRLHGSPD